MALRGIKPTAIKPRLKALFYGNAGCGKTTAAISFPFCYLIDTEQGAIHKQYIDLLEKNEGSVFQTTDFDELITEVKSLLTVEHPYKTLVIDPLTTLYNDLLDKAAIQVGTEFGKHYGVANKKMKHLLSLLTRLDMNVIITSHSKNEYASGMTVIGTTFDCYKKLDYLFDLVFEISKRGKERVGIVKKTRIEGFPEGDIFPFSYAEIAKRYGKDVIERNSVIVKLADEKQVSEAMRLIDLLNVPKESIDKWLEKANAITLDEMNHDTIQKVIDHLNSKIKGI